MENPAGKPPASRESAGAALRLPAGGDAPLAPSFPPERAAGAARGSAGAGTRLCARGKRALRTGAPATNPVGLVLIRLSRNSLGLTSVISPEGKHTSAIHGCVK